MESRSGQMYQSIGGNCGPEVSDRRGSPIGNSSWTSLHFLLDLVNND